MFWGVLGKALGAGRMQLYTVALVLPLADHKPLMATCTRSPRWAAAKVGGEAAACCQKHEKGCASSPGKPGMSWRCLPWGAEGEDTVQPWLSAVPHQNCSVKDKSPPQLIFTLKNPQNIWTVFEKLNCKWARKACCGHLYQPLLLHVALPINQSIIA